MVCSLFWSVCRFIISFFLLVAIPVNTYDFIEILHRLRGFECMAANDGINCIWSFMNWSWENVGNKFYSGGFFTFVDPLTRISMNFIGATTTKAQKKPLLCNQKRKTYDVTNRKLSWKYELAYAAACHQSSVRPAGRDRNVHTNALKLLAD